MKLSTAEKIKLELYNNFMLFCKELLPHHFEDDPALIHFDLAEKLFSGSLRQAFILPRELAKTTIISLAYPLRQILFNESHFIVLASDTETSAMLNVDNLRYELETNDKIRELFGDVRGETWGSKYFITSTGIMVMARGVGQQIRGLKFRQHRPDLIIGDDIESKETAATSEQRRQIRAWVFGDVLPASPPGGRVYFVGTILAYDSLLARIAKSAGFDVTTGKKTLKEADIPTVEARRRSKRGIRFDVMYSDSVIDGKPIWPARMTLDDLEEIKQVYRDMGEESRYYLEYHNRVVTEDQSFRPEFFQTYTLTPQLEKSLNIFMAVDPAISERDTADYSAIVVAGTDPKGNLYILQYTNEHLTPLALIKRIFDLHIRWDPLLTGFESVSYQKSLKYFIEEEMRNRQYFFTLQELKPDRDKRRRIMRLQPKYERRMVYHLPGMDELEGQLIAVSPTSMPTHDDVADALAYIPEMEIKPMEAPTDTIETEATAMDRVFAKIRVRADHPKRDWSSN